MRRMNWPLVLVIFSVLAAPTARADFDLTLEHEWTWAEPTGTEIMTTPSVARKSRCGATVTALAHRSSNSAPYRVTLLDEDGTVLVADLGRDVYPETVVLADVIGFLSPGVRDGIPEVLAVTPDIPDGEEVPPMGPHVGNRIVCWSLDGTEEWIGPSPVPVLPDTTLGVADFDCDDIPEVIAGSSVYTTGARTFLPGEVLFTGGAGRGAPPFSGLAASHAVDLDGDGCLELLAGNTLYRPLACGGQPAGIIWDASSYGVPDGYTAVGDFIEDGAPEIMLLTSVLEVVTTWLLSADGQVLGTSPFAAPNGVRCSPPVVGNFDSDAKSEWTFAQTGFSSNEPLPTRLWSGGWTDLVAGTSSLIVFPPVAIDDRTGVSTPTAFDFDADGIDEIVHADHVDLMIVEAGNPTPLIRMSRGGSQTGLEHPVVVQLDDDPHAEILFVHGASDPDDDDDDPAHPDVPGLSVYQVVGSDTPRSVSNQHGYHVDHAYDNATIPCEANVEPWATHGTWMAQVPACRLDFELGELPAGTVVTDQFLPQGVSVQGLTNQVVIFDTANAACDPDLETPSPTAATENRVPRDRVLILMERESPCLPADDEDDGGTMVFTFTSPRDIDAIGLLDIDDSDETYVYVSTDSGTYTFTADILEDNSYQRLDIGLDCVVKIMVDFGGSGAVTNIFCGPLDSDIQRWDASF